MGRQADAQIRLPDPGVSRQHCEIQLDAARPTIKDLGSSNGTYVNRRRVSQTELSAGDVLSIGPFVFVFRVDGEPSNIDTEEVLEDAVEVGAPAKAPAANGNAGAAPVAGREPPTRLRPVRAETSPRAQGCPVQLACAQVAGLDPRGRTAVRAQCCRLRASTLRRPEWQG